jgi:hypothetical protein
MANEGNRYAQIIQAIFAKYYRKGAQEVSFERADIELAAEKLGIVLPKNIGDVLYSFRYRQDLPSAIAQKAPEGQTWIIRPAGRSRYKFVLVPQA